MLKKYKISETDLSAEGGSVFLALGSNKGDREQHLRNAFAALKRGGFRLGGVSSMYETEPVGCEAGAGIFLNCVIRGNWSGSADELLNLCQSIEVAEGRSEHHAHWVSRELDIDLILFGNEVIHTERLTVPHPLVLERPFVLEPLQELSAEAVMLLKKLQAQRGL